MTAKEKANELINKFIEPTKVPNVKGIWVEDLDGAKQCALITVDEILNLVMIDTNESIEHDFGDTRKYWQEVKSEIEKI